jgi:hypothetical protein
VSRRSRGSSAQFYDEFRTALARAPEGLLRVGPPAQAGAVAAAEAALGQPLPRSYTAFLQSFDGADLFQETVVLAGVGPEAFRSIVELNRPPRPALVRKGEILFAEAAGGDRLLFSDGDDDARVVRLRAGSDERWLAGSSFPQWLDALVAREQLLYDPEGEFRIEAFEPDGEEVTPTFALRQAERAVRKDPGSAEAHHDLGVAQRRLGHLDRAADAFAEAAALDPENPWPSFDLGRAALSRGRPADAMAAFAKAADATPGAEGARFLAWAGRAALEAGQRPQAEELRRRALERAPGIGEDLERAAKAAAAEGDEEARVEAEALWAVFDARRRRLPVV